MNLFHGFHDLLFPPRCLGCAVLNVGLCGRCSIDWKLREYSTYVGRVPVFSSVRYNATASHILLAAKEDGVRKADDLLVSALRHSLRVAIRTTGIRPTLVPIPSAQKAIRNRGRHFVFEITKRVGTLEGLPIQDLARHNRRISDQSVLDANSRFENLADGISVAAKCGRPREVFLVDDLVTTGATLGEAVRALEKVGFHVAAAVTAFVALPLR